jgi:ribosome-associated heat shock protein Hsp15
MISLQQVRIDKWLWMVRIFKTRSMASEACKKGRIFVNENEAKASKDVRAGDIVSVRKPPIKYTFNVKDIPKNRVGAKLLDDYLENITPNEELEKIDPNFLAFHPFRDRGSGRPTKKERRTLEDIKNLVFEDWDEPNV